MQIRLLGVPEVKFIDRLSPSFKTAKAEGLFYYLATTQRTHTRATLSTLFWGDMEEVKARVNLSKALSDLREQVGDYVTITTQTVAFNRGLAYQLDVEAFHMGATKQPSSETIDALQVRANLYRGDFLEGFYVRNAPDFEQWVYGERERLRTAAAQLLTTLAEGYQQNGDLPNAISTLRRLLALEPWREAAHYQLMDLLVRNGEPQAALRQYELCRLALADELDVEPGVAIKQLYTKIRTNGKAAEPRESSAALSGKSTASKPSFYLPQPATPFAGRAEEMTDLTAPQPELVANAPFVGRQHEWQTLQARWRLALRGQPQFVLIAGEAGIGKTRLAEELLNWAQHHGFGTVRARCYAAEGRLTYAPIIEWLRADTLRPHRSKVPATWLTELARLLPELLTEQPNLPRPEPITSTWLRHQLFEAATRALLALDQPLILLIDDLQWCDKETLELLHFLLRHAARLSPTKVLLVGTARLPDEVEATHPLYELLNPLRGGDTLTQLDLVRLTETETNQLARQMTERTLDHQTLHQLFHDTAGNPLFVVETMRATQGQLALNGGVAKAPSALLPLEASETLTQQLPPKVQAVLQARLGQLSPIARELCEWAAIVGRAFTLELLTSASKIAADKVVNALDELWQRRIIREQGTAAYDFSHDRLRDVATAGISRVRRRYLHRCVAEALEEQNVGQLDSIAAEIAAHFEAAGMIEKAIQYFEQAAIHTQLIFAHNPTVVLLEHTLKLLKTLSEGNKRDLLELKLLNRLTTVLANMTGYTTTNLIDVIEGTYNLSQKLHISPSPIFMRMLAIYRLGINTFDQVQELGNGILDLVHNSSEKPDNVLLVEGAYVHGVNAFWHGNFAISKSWLKNAIDHYSVENHKRHLVEYASDTGSYCHVRLGLTLWYLGYPEQAARECEIGISSAQELKDLNTIGLNVAFTLWLRCEQNDLASAKDLQEKFFAHASQTPPTRREAFLFLEGWYHYLCGNFQTCIEQLSDYLVVRDLRRTDTVYRNLAFLLLARAYTALGDRENAFTALAQSEAFYDRHDDWWSKAEFLRVKGDLFITFDNQVNAAEEYYYKALELSRTQQAKSLELRAAMSLARLWDQQGKPREAYTLLAEVYNWFTEGFDTADLQEAKSLLARLA
ncbi:MAG: AAA family ATPase [Caldilineaceae bacterium]